MKIYISADIEGVAGICNWSETDEKGYDYSFFRQEMTNEVKACCEKLIELGITDITVRDAHDSARNILFDQLPKEVKIIREWSGGICDMMDGLDNSYDAAIMIGYHSPSRSEGNPLSHTMNTRHNHIKINNKVVSEYLLNTYYAQTLKVPVIMVSGDQRLMELVKEENDRTITVATKEGLHGAIISKHPEAVYEEIKQGTENAIKTLKNCGKETLFVNVPRILDMEIHYRNHRDAYRATQYPSAQRLSDDKTIFKTNSVHELLRFMLFCD